LELNEFAKKADEMNTKCLEIVEGTNERMKLIDQKLEKASEIGDGLKIFLGEVGMGIINKIEMEETIARQERERLFVNANSLKQDLTENAAVIGDKIIQKLGRVAQEEVKKTHDVVEFTGKLLNDKMNQKFGTLELKILEKLKTTTVEEKASDILETVQREAEGVRQNQTDIMNKLHVEMENAKEERRMLNENLAHTQVTLANISEVKMEDMKNQFGTIMVANNEAIIRAGNEGINMIREVITVQMNKEKTLWKYRRC
jgi:hypothetical protein